MNHDEFAFFNQQLAAMLRDGIPLEGALKHLSADMRDPALRREVQQLERDLAAGTPLTEALAQRRLPELYSRMVAVGARSNDLPEMLTLLADHYQRAGALWNRLKGLIVYPLIVIVVSLGLTVALSLVFRQFLGPFTGDPNLLGFRGFSPGVALAALWVSPLLLFLAGAVGVGILMVPSFRAAARWRVPAFRDASLAQLASSIALMLRNGVPLPDALAMAEVMESNSPAGRALGWWRRSVEAGEGKADQWPKSLHPFPPLFLWLVKKGGEDAAAGFSKAAELYRTRASHRIELALYGALPVSVLLLGVMIFWQIAPILRVFIVMMNALGDVGGM
jgi:type II secretory pathway component PulF